MPRAYGHVVVTVPYFRCRPYLRQCIESLLGQTHRDLTVVVTNDGDACPPWDLLEDLEDPRIVRFDLPSNHGRYFADQVVLATTDAPFLLVHDADDWSEPTRVEVLLRELRRDHSCAAVTAADRPRPGGGTPPLVRCARIARPLTARLEHRAPYQGLYRTDALRSVGGFYAGFRLGYDTFLLSALAMTGRVTPIAEPLYHWRSRPDSLTQAPASGHRSPARAQARRTLRAMYREAFESYTNYLDGRLDADELKERIHALVTAKIDAQARTALEHESRRLADATAASRPSRRPPAAAPAPGPLAANDLLPGGDSMWGRSTGSRRLAVALAQRLEQRRPRRVLETGSGLSTLVLARYAAESGARIVTLEHHRGRAARTLRRLADAGLGGAVDLRVVPLRPHVCPDGQSRPWYDTPLPGRFELVVVNGPRRGGRAGALFALAPLLADAWELWLPNAEAPSARKCLELWAKHLRFARGEWSLGGAQVAELGPAAGGAPLAATAAAPRSGRASSLLFWSALDLHRWRPARTGPEWIEYRFRHWLAYTLPSILAQHEADFRYWLICDPAGRALTEPLRTAIRDDRVRLVYADECAGLLRRLPRQERHLVARLDSDDLYHPAVAGDLLARRHATRFLQFNEGYACDVRTGDLRRWTARSSPFYCQVYGDELRRRQGWREPNHPTVRAAATVLRPGRALVTLHDENTSSSIRIGSTPVPPARRRDVLERFGLGGPRSLDALAECSLAPADWDARAGSIRTHVEEARRRRAGDAMSLEAATFFAFLCELTAPRRILVLGSSLAADVAREHGAVDTVLTPLGGGYDLLLLDRAGDTAPVRLLHSALRCLRPSGLAMINNCQGAGPRPDELLTGWCADHYPEASELSRDAAGRHATLLGRVIPPRDAR